jgi:hypothetical protein
VLGNHDVDEGRQDQCQYPLFHGAGNYYKIREEMVCVSSSCLIQTTLARHKPNWLKALSRFEGQMKMPFHHPFIHQWRTSDRAEETPRAVVYSLRCQRSLLRTRSHLRTYQTAAESNVCRLRRRRKVRRGDVDRGSGIRASFDGTTILR